MVKDKQPVSARARMGAVLVGLVLCLVGLLCGTATTAGQWLLLIGGAVVLVNLLLAGFRLMREG